MTTISNENDDLRPKRGVAMNLTYTGVPTNEYDNGRDEKPWQRVAFELTKKGKHLYEPVKSVPSTFILVLLAWYLLFGYLAQLIEDGMPSPVQNADLARDDTSTFSEQSARQYLTDIIGSGPRVSGTPYHLNQTIRMKAIVDAIAVQANQPVRTDWQIVSGNYIHESAASFHNVYENASNVIAILEGESGFHGNGTVGSSVLLNCHYDSVPFADGASDNAVFCAVMLETLSKLSRRTNKLKHNVIFLFNGAEENGLQASHGFLQHPWSVGVKTVVNLDAAGMNGKPTVFQVTDPQTLSVYAKSVPHPNAQGFGEFLFSSGVIPSDTDFRIFRDFGHIHGIDIAFVKWGVVYHTRYDRVDLLQRGVVQHAGDMIMALTAGLADQDTLEPAPEPQTYVYYDYINLFLIRYSFAAAYAVDTVHVVIALASIAYYVWFVGPRMSTIQELLLAAVGRVAAVVAGVAVVFVFTAIMVATTTQLRYLSEPWLVVPLYWLPFAIGAVAASQTFDAWRIKKSGLNRCIRALQAHAATRLLLTLLLVVMMCVPSLQSARYVISTPLAIMAMTSLVSLTFLRYIRLKAGQHLLLECVLSFPSTIMVLSLALRLDAMLIPITGRSALGDYVVAAANVALAVLVANTMSGVELLFSRRRLWLPLSVVAAVCVVLMFIPFAPYQDNGPATMRHYWFHSEIVSYDQNKNPIETTTAVVVNRQDMNTVPRVREALQRAGIHAATTHSAHCSDRLYCDLPLFRTSYARFLPQALLISTGGPAPLTPRPDVVYTRTCVANTCTYSFNVTGTHHNTITIWPRPGTELQAWSFSSPLHIGGTLLERPFYVIVHSVATYPLQRGFNFTLTCNVPSSQQSQVSLDVSHHSHLIYHPELFTPEYVNLINAMPKYFNIATFLSYRHNYQIV